MLKFEKCKKILQAKGGKYSDEEVKKIQKILYDLATIVDDTQKMKDGEKMGK
ncbi:hypothetical protein KRX57_04940 [Weeksellaceae bacterium TAE3-ERU29]|nr:hypothetical protein [Weeksellaceae bacterium TAE3-ERU29]